MAGSVTMSGVSSLTWDKLIEPDIAAFTVKVAEEALKEVVAAGFDNQPVVITDGVPNRDWKLVKPFGKIEFARRPAMAECVRWILAELIAKSPVGPGRNGHYRDKHVLMINGVQAANEDLDKVKPTDRVQIVNTQPYAKKIEGAKADRKAKLKRERGSSRQAPSGVYQVVQREAIARYGRSIFIDFKYLRLNLDRPQVTRRRAHGRRITPRKVDPLYPAIQLFIKTLNG